MERPQYSDDYVYFIINEKDLRKIPQACIISTERCNNGEIMLRVKKCCTSHIQKDFITSGSWFLYASNNIRRE
jgi:hypothetical protein